VLIVFQDLTVPAAFCFATGMYATGAVPVLLHGTTWRRDLHQAAVHAGHILNRAIAAARHELAPYAAYARHAAYSAREAGRDAVALLILLTTRPKGAL
jgi:hypothetical protein